MSTRSSPSERNTVIGLARIYFLCIGNICKFVNFVGLCRIYLLPINVICFFNSCRTISSYLIRVIQFDRETCSEYLIKYGVADLKFVRKRFCLFSCQLDCRSNRLLLCNGRRNQLTTKFNRASRSIKKVSRKKAHLVFVEADELRRIKFRRKSMRSLSVCHSCCLWRRLPLRATNSPKLIFRIHYVTKMANV